MFVYHAVRLVVLLGVMKGVVALSPDVCRTARAVGVSIYAFAVVIAAVVLFGLTKHVASSRLLRHGPRSATLLYFVL